MATGDAIQKQQTKYVEGTKTGKNWSVEQFGKRLQSWQKMAAATSDPAERRRVMLAEKSGKAGKVK